MKRVLTIVAVLLSLDVTLRSQTATSGDSCPHTGEELARQLETAKTCDSAASLLERCAWGSSADASFAPIVITKCEKTILPKLSHSGFDHYAEEMQLCAYREARAQGTMSISAAALCQVETAVEAAKYPSRYERPMPRASFDCGQAKSRMEKAICSDRALGKADIMLSRIYQQTLHAFAGTDTAPLVADQRQWLKDIQKSCGFSSLPAEKAQLSCLRASMEVRFTAMDGCFAAAAEENWASSRCVEAMHEKPDDEDAAASPSLATPRASFDCEAPTTALQIVICADARLGQLDVALDKLRKANPDATGDLDASQEKWLHFISRTCPLGAVGGIPDLYARGCVRSALETRVRQLTSCVTGPSDQRVPCLNDFHLSLDELDQR